MKKGNINVYEFLDAIRGITSPAQSLILVAQKIFTDLGGILKFVLKKEFLKINEIL